MLYEVLGDLRYNNLVFRPGATNDFKKLDQAEITRLIRQGLIKPVLQVPEPPADNNKTSSQTPKETDK